MLGLFSLSKSVCCVGRVHQSDESHKMTQWRRALGNKITTS